MRTTSSALVRLALGLVISLLAGVVLAGLALPVVGGLGLIGKSAADELVPEQPPTVALAQRSRILDRNGGVLATLFSENRVPVALRDVPELAQKALVAIEDSRFYEHKGLDVKGTLRAVAKNSTTDDVQGGSTLTQQYAKNLRIEAASTTDGQKLAKERSVRRKLQEAKYALWLEENLTKDQILEGYLNIAYYGSGVYGIGTAANHYFSVPVRRLTLGQGALLAGMVQSPSKYDPTKAPKAAVTRRNTVLQRMADLGYITDAARAKATAEPLRLRVTTVKSGCEAPGVTAPFFCDYVRRYLEEGPVAEALGDTKQKRQERLLQGGLTIKTTLDPKVQEAAQRGVDTEVPRGDPFQAYAVSDVVEPGTGRVRAMAVNRAYGEGAGQTKLNYALGGSQGFQGGSTFKAFVLARALQMGIAPSLKIYAPGRYCSDEIRDGSDPYCVSNSEPAEAGTFDLVRATWASVNTYFLQLEERTGIITPPGLAEALGVRQVDGTLAGAPLKRFGSFVLGADDTSPLMMAGAYAAFASHGAFCAPRPVTEILDATGKAILIPEQPCSQVLEPEVADTVAAILQGVVNGTSSHTGGGAAIGRPVAGKTGTTNDSKAAWFIGFTPQLATAVWIGKKTPEPMRRVTINGRYYKQVYGGTIPAAIFAKTMSGALAGVPVEAFTDVRLAATTAPGIPVPDVTGQPLDAAADQLRAAGFGVATGAAVNGAPVPSGGVAFSSPAAGTKVPAGSTVTLYPSNGLAPVVPPTPASTVAPSAGPTPAPTTPATQPPPASPAASPQPQPTKTKKGG